jgi:hypothetical protein
MKSESGLFQGLPVTMESVVRARARNNHVLLTGGTFAYHEIIMSFVCNLRRLGMYDELVIAAFDDELFEYGLRMGLSVFRYDHHVFTPSASSALTYGSTQYMSMTKIKTRIVLDVLRLGFDVTWTDTDIVYFKNPLPYLNAMESDFVIQSDATNRLISRPTTIQNTNMNICSGFYRIRSKPATIAVFVATLFLLLVLPLIFFQC